MLEQLYSSGLWEVTQPQLNTESTGWVIPADCPESFPELPPGPWLIVTAEKWHADTEQWLHKNSESHSKSQGFPFSRENVTPAATRTTDLLTVNSKDTESSSTSQKFPLRAFNAWGVLHSWPLHNIICYKNDRTSAEQTRTPTSSKLWSEEAETARDASGWNGSWPTACWWFWICIKGLCCDLWGSGGIP